MFDDTSTNVRADKFMLVCAHTNCPHCCVEIEVVALALPPAHEWREEDSPNSWYRATAAAVLFNVSQLAPELTAAIESLAPGYRLEAGEGEGTLWCNYCAFCGEAIDDGGLHCEPGGPFIPISADEVRFVLRIVGMPFTAQAGGYASNPPFFPEFPT